MTGADATIVLNQGRVGDDTTAARLKLCVSLATGRGYIYTWFIRRV